ncbi:MAG TPA: DNA primase [Candidatus Saccharimonadales bacterium]|nr:DNA primase [Candidatus Saccharimonadales bacterium]
MEAVEEIKNRLNIEDVVGQYVQLKRAGRNFKGISPFSNERTPSFMVSPEKQIWHDFSSGKGGNMFSFVMEMEGLDFKGALELLARKAGVDLEQYRKTSTTRTGGNKKERLFAALEAATRFYQVQFSKHRPAWEYVLGKRAFSKQTALEWRLGYSPDSGTALVDFLRQKGFTDSEIKNAGLSAQRYRGVGDMFRSRIMIPLADPQGRIIGFTARQLKDDPNGPKYINTPQTPLYDKSRHVFGLHLAKEAIRKSKFVVLAEGNLDVIASHQAGVRQVVATAGTALTEWQLKALGRFTPDIRLSFDADAAGLNATERAIPIASKVGVSLSIISIPSGKDPDELIRSDKSTWEEIIQKPQYALDWLFERYQNQLDLSTAPGKKQFSDVVLRVIRSLQDPVEQEHYVAKAADLLSVSKMALQSKLQGIATDEPKIRPKTNRPVVAFDKAAADLVRTQNHLLALAFLKPGERQILSTFPTQILPDEPARKLAALLQEQPEIVVDSPALRPLEEYGKIVTLLFEEVYQDVDALELANEAQRLRDHLVTGYVKMQKQRIAHELQSAAPERATQLLGAAKKLDALLKSQR